MRRILSALIIVLIMFAVGCSSQSSKNPPAVENSAESGTMPSEGSSQNDNSGNARDRNDNYVETQNKESSSNENSAPQLKAASAEADSSNAAVSKELDDAIAKAILDYNKGSYIEGESRGEGHIIMDVATESSSLKVYTLTMYGEYSFINDMFIKISGSGVIPAVITLQEGMDETYSVINYQEPEDGSGYAASIKKLFPNPVYNRVASISDSDRIYLTNDERQYARDYLASIGRSAKIGDYSDIDFQYPDIPSDIEKTIFDRYWEYPDWLGTTEKIEDGVRYVYETQWKDYGNNDSMIYLTKYVYDTGEIIRTINVHIDNGVIQSSEEKVLRLIENSSNNKQ